MPPQPEGRQRFAAPCGVGTRLRWEDIDSSSRLAWHHNSLARDPRDFCHGLLALAWTGRTPERVPTHFGFGGDPDAWAAPAALWALPAVAVALWAGLSWVARIPHHYNYPWAITAANAERQYRLARRLVIALKALVGWQFLLVQLQTLEVAAGQRAGLSVGLVLSFLFAPLALVVAYLVAASRPRTSR